MIIPGTRATCLCTGLVVCVLGSVAYAGDDPGRWRLFDPEPATESAQSQLQKKNQTRQQDKQTAGENQAASRFLVFNGVVSSSLLNAGRSEPLEALWLNGYPVDESSLPIGVRAVKWRADLQVLEVIFSSGSREYLSPGNSVLLEN